MVWIVIRVRASSWTMWTLEVTKFTPELWNCSLQEENHQSNFAVFKAINFDLVQSRPVTRNFNRQLFQRKVDLVTENSYCNCFYYTNLSWVWTCMILFSNYNSNFSIEKRKGHKTQLHIKAAKFCRTICTKYIAS